MTKEEQKTIMLQEESRLHNEIRKIYPNSAGLDGIVDIDSYLDIKNSSSKPIKILWVLKERGYPKNKINKEFFLSDYMKCIAQYSRWKNTYEPMCIVSEAILEWQRTTDDKYLNINNLPSLEIEAPKEYAAVNYIQDDGVQVFPLDHIAFLNIKKIGWCKNTSEQYMIDREYNRPEIQKILSEQFNYINPDIIIFGNKVKKIAEDFSGVSFSNYIHFDDYGALDYYYDVKRNKLFIFADHPSAIPPTKDIKKDAYSQSILNVIKLFRRELLK